MKIMNKAMTSVVNKISQSNQRLFEDWLRYLLIINDNPENKHTLLNYFFDKFASAPYSFYLFLGYFKEQLPNHPEQKKIAKKYLDILSPLCERFNFFEEKNLLNDLCFKILAPEKYQEIYSIFSKYEQKSQKIIQAILKTLDCTLQGRGLEYKLIGRCKNIYSIYEKIEKKGKDLLEITDIFAFRIILQTNKSSKCFEVANILHDKFSPIPDLFKDYITIPKINGYQSIHTALRKVIDNLDLPIEIQIRTKEMDEFAENGLAAHWLYAKDKKFKLMTPKEERLIKYFSCVSRSQKKADLIYCFTRQGDMIKVDKKYTILDFAYMIHTELGNKASYALVNNVRKPIYHKIKEGDQIQIITADDIQIEKKWLDYTYTKNAHKKIKDYLNQHV